VEFQFSTTEWIYSARISTDGYITILSICQSNWSESRQEKGLDIVLQDTSVFSRLDLLFETIAVCFAYNLPLLLIFSWNCKSLQFIYPLTGSSAMPTTSRGAHLN